MPGATLGELALLKILQERIPNASQKHVRVLLCIARHKNGYLSMNDIGQGTLLNESELNRVMQALSGKNLVRKEGCLFRKPVDEMIFELI